MNFYRQILHERRHGEGYSCVDKIPLVMPSFGSITMDKGYSYQSADNIIEGLETSPSTGLAADEASRRLNKFGSNRIVKGEHMPWLRILAGQFKSPIVYLLLFAALVSFYFQEWLDAAAIMAVLIINALIGFYMEFQAGLSMKALRKLASVPAKVLRDKKLIEIDSHDIVPGDILFVEPGDMISADARIISLSDLQVDESALTGESMPVTKTSSEIVEAVELPDRANMLFKGTFVGRGNAWAVVTTTGMQTELGKIASLVSEADQAATPLEKKLEEFSKKLIQITVGLVLVIFFSGWLMGHELFTMINTAIALAVAAIPEGLPIVATLGLARGMLKMAKHKVIVKKLSAVETLGGTSVICTDKTGTLTENRMTVKIIVPGMNEAEEVNNLILKASVLCNTAEMYDGQNAVGDPLEIALLKFSTQYISIEEVRMRFPKLGGEPFSSESKRMITVHKDRTGSVSFAKGAVEEIIRICSRTLYPRTQVMSASLEKRLLRSAEQLASSGYKIIAFAYLESTSGQAATREEFIFLGFVGLIDPPRPEVPKAIAQCKTAGIKVVMVTGDHPQTASQIARELGLADSLTNTVISGKDMRPYEQLSQEDKAQWLTSTVFARVSPIQKLDLIKVYQEEGFVVGMTGDGVNDAPALKKADIGIAMGQRGTQVAQDVADMVIKDDSFSSIVTAIREGRIIFSNIRKFVIYLLSCNLSELFAIAVTAVINLQFQLLPLQILFINLITDVLPAIALGMTPGNPGIMQKPPRKPDHPVIDRHGWTSIIFYSAVMSLASLGAVLVSQYVLNGDSPDTSGISNNILFFTLIGSQLLHVLNMNSSVSNFFDSEVVRNKFVWYSIVTSVVILVFLYEIPVVRQVLNLQLLTFRDWLLIITFSAGAMVINQLAKVLKIIRQ